MLEPLSASVSSDELIAESYVITHAESPGGRFVPLARGMLIPSKLTSVVSK